MKYTLKKVLLISLMAVSAMAYSDSDLDGVPDSLDKCPNTPFTNLVNKNGCTIKKLAPTINYHHFDVMVGAEYLTSNFDAAPKTDTYNATFQVDYYYKNFSLQASTSYYTTDSDNYSADGMNDSYIGVSYTLYPVKNLSVRLGAGVILPTYDTTLNNNNTDYSFSTYVSYSTLKKVNLFGSYTYTMINDDDTAVTYADGYSYTYRYQNTSSWSLGAGRYLLSGFYMSASFNNTQSIYRNVDDAQTVSLYGYYSIDKNWFLSLYYAYGLSDTASDHDISLKLGYYF